MRVLVSGFEPFLNEKVNPTFEIVRFVNARSDTQVRAILLPVLFDKAFEELEQARLEFQPDVILSFGLAAGRNSIDFEQTAANLRGRDTGAVAGSAAGVGPVDNAGVVGSGKIIDSAPAFLPSTLPTEVFMKALREAGVPARLSADAGTYVCNDLFFQMQHHLQSTEVRSGFIHVPRLAVSEESETAWPWWKLEKAVTTIFSALASETHPRRRE